jgi:hypothetical protein
MLGDLRIDQLFAMRFKLFQSAFREDVPLFVELGGMSVAGC